MRSAVDVGLFGLAISTTRVRSVIAATIASASNAWRLSGTVDSRAAGEPGELRVGDEARPRVDDLVAVVDVREGELFEQADGARPDGDASPARRRRLAAKRSRSASAVWSA